MVERTQVKDSDSSQMECEWETKKSRVVVSDVK